MGGIRPGQAKGPWVGSVIAVNELTGAANVGTGTGLVYRDITAHTLNLRTLLEGDGITIVTAGDEITISSTEYSDVYWQKPIITIFDNTAATPAGPVSGDRYIALVTAHGWTINHIYQWNGATWTDTTPLEGMATYNKNQDIIYNYTGAAWKQVVTFENLGDSPYGLYAQTVLGVAQFKSLFPGSGISMNTSTDPEVVQIDYVPNYWVDPIISIFDNTAALPVGPATGARYIALVTANGWTANQLYQWTGAAWYTPMNPIPEGVITYDLANNTIYYYTGTVWTAISSGTGSIYWLDPVISVFDPTAAFPVAPTPGDRYISSATATHGPVTWTDKHVYEWNGATWDDTTPLQGMVTFNLDTKMPLQFWTTWDPVTGYQYSQALHEAAFFRDNNGHVGQAPDVSVTEFNCGMLVSSTLTNQAASIGIGALGYNRILLTKDATTDDLIVNVAGGGNTLRIVQASGVVKLMKLVTNGHVMTSGGDGTLSVLTTQHITYAANEIAPLTSKGSPVGGDFLIIEDSADGNKKKQILISSLPAGSSVPHSLGGAQHTADIIANVQLKLSDGKFITSAADEIHTLTDQKNTLTLTDQFLIEDAADSYKKKKANIGAIPAMAPAAHAFAGALHAADTIANVQTKLSSGKFITSAADEIHTLTDQKNTLTLTDQFLIEDGADSWKKKKANISAIPAMAPAAHAFAGALHTADTIANVQTKLSNGKFITSAADEIHTLTDQKNTLTLTDQFLIEDGADSWKKKKANISAIPALAPAAHAFGGALHSTDTIANVQTRLSSGKFITSASNEIATLTLKAVPTLTDMLMIEDAAATNAKKYITIGSLPAAAPAAHAFGGALHSTDTIANVQTRLSSGKFITSASAEISTLTNKATPTTADLLLIEDAAATNAKKYITIGALPAAAPAAHAFGGALHSTDTIANVQTRLSSGKFITSASAEISTLTNKATPTTSDLLLIEDAAATNAKKYITIGALPAAAPAAHAFGGALHSTDTIANVQSRLSSGNFITSVAGEIAALTEKTVPVAADLLMIEDSAATNAKKKLQISNLLSALQFPQFQFFADQVMVPWDAEFPVNGNNMATTGVDSNNGSITNRQFDDTTEEGIAVPIFIPSGVTNIIFDFYSRAETGPSGAKGVVPAIYYRTVGDNAAPAAWSARYSLTALTMPTTTEYFQYDTQTVSLATLSLTAGTLVYFELTRYPAAAGDTLVGDWDLNLLRIRFS